ncbi:hypothetical protein [Tsuneonella mangrovi]|uniref:hypothetical protein n=1 Tax=Tsuneonella mangrovi TaxID=1982042 RepID=UPI000BA2B42B|nr:hypothetical protein [Tsuneonella mangrovi]
MTTPDDAASGKRGKKRVTSKSKKERIKREPTPRQRPDRSGANIAAAAPHPGHAEPEAAKQGPKFGPDDGHHHDRWHAKAKTANSGEALHIDEAVAEAVRSGYDVLSETIAQGRRAAELFRQGNYSFRKVPYDVEAMAHRLLDLTRQLSTTTFDICEQLLAQFAAASGPPPPGETASAVPGFRDIQPVKGKAKGKTNGSAQHGVKVHQPHREHHRQDHRKLPLTIQFSGKKAAALVKELDRPTNPTGVWEITSTSLVPREGNNPAIDAAGIKFEADVSAGGLLVTIDVPPNQPAGVYSGMVTALSQDIPLGVIVVQVKD